MNLQPATLAYLATLREVLGAERRAWERTTYGDRRNGSDGWRLACRWLYGRFEHCRAALRRA